MPLLLEAPAQRYRKKETKNSEEWGARPQGLT